MKIKDPKDRGIVTCEDNLDVFVRHEQNLTIVLILFFLLDISTTGPGCFLFWIIFPSFLYYNVSLLGTNWPMWLVSGTIWHGVSITWTKGLEADRANRAIRFVTTPPLCRSVFPAFLTDAPAYKLPDSARCTSDARIRLREIRRYPVTLWHDHCHFCVTKNTKHRKVPFMTCWYVIEESFISHLFIH